MTLRLSALVHGIRGGEEDLGMQTALKQTGTDTCAESDHAGTVLRHLISHRLIQFETAVKYQTVTHL